MSLRPRLNRRRVAVARVGDEAVLLDLVDYGAVRANPAAALALRLANGRRPAAAIAAAVAARFGVPRRRALADLRGWLGELERRGWLASPPRPRGAAR